VVENRISYGGKKKKEGGPRTEKQWRISSTDARPDVEAAGRVGGMRTRAAGVGQGEVELKRKAHSEGKKAAGRTQARKREKNKNIAKCLGRLDTNEARGGGKKVKVSRQRYVLIGLRRGPTTHTTHKGA